MIITVGGQAASGKSTLAKALAEKLGYSHISAGKLMRDMADEHGMTLLEFSKYAEEHPEVDVEIDERQKKLAKDDCVVDGRLSRYFLDPDLSIWLIAPSATRAERVLGRGEKYKTSKDAEKDIIARDASERTRYLKYYEIDVADLSKYDLVLNTGKFNIPQMTSVAVCAAHSLIK